MKSILIIEDEILVAKSIEKILVNYGYNVVGIALNTRQAKQLILSNSIDLILSDINLNEVKSGIDFITEVKSISTVPFIFISSYSDRYTLEQADQLCPFTYITKPFSEKQLIASVNRIFLNMHEESSTPSDRELVILNLISKGFSTKEIAETLSISFHTVESHRKNLLNKYGVKSMAELICLATSKGWITYQEK